MEQRDHETPEQTAEVQEVVKVREESSGRNQMQNSEDYAGDNDPAWPPLRTAAQRFEDQSDVHEPVGAEDG